jgi:hypothetical protein
MLDEPRRPLGDEAIARRGGGNVVFRIDCFADVVSRPPPSKLSYAIIASQIKDLQTVVERVALG